MSRCLAAFTPTVYEGYYPPFINASEVESDKVLVLVRGRPRAPTSVMEMDFAQIEMTQEQWRTFLADTIASMSVSERRALGEAVAAKFVYPSAA